MRYISDDGKIFETEQDCLNHENHERARIEEEIIRKEQLETERKNMLNFINAKYESLKKDIFEYEKKFGVKQPVNFIPFYEIVDMFYN